MQINGNIVVLPVPAEKQELTFLPDRFETGERVQTPRGSFQLTAMSREQMEAAGYGVHHISDDGKYLIMGNGTRAVSHDKLLSIKMCIRDSRNTIPSSRMWMRCWPFQRTRNNSGGMNWNKFL